MTRLTVNASTIAGGCVPEHLELWVSSPSVRDATGKMLRLGGFEKFPVKTGRLSIELLATDTPDTDPLPNTWGYTFELRWQGGGLPKFDASLPASPGEVDLSELQPMDPANPLYRGPKGDTGDKGDTGNVGPKGDKGDVGPAGMTWRGAWSVLTEYATDDAVAHDGTSWFAALDPPVGEEPTDASTYWQVFALRGSQGNTGPKGDTGDVGPKGDTGAIGLTGNTGPTGANGAGNLNGSGSPEGVITATVGTIYADTALTTGAAIWRKNTGSGNTGWKVIAGDTGQRTLTNNALVDGTRFNNVNSATNYLRLRRVGNIVYLTSRIVRTLASGSRGTAAEGIVMTGWPAGFAPAGGGGGGGFIGNGVTQLLADVQTGSDLRFIASGSWAAGDSCCVRTSFVTDDAWPTTLP